MKGSFWHRLSIVIIVFGIVISTWGCSSAPKFRRDEIQRPVDQRDYDGQPYQVGLASFYSTEFHGRSTSSGETFDMYDLTAAHNTLPLGSIVKITNLENHKSVVVRINDRGPFVEGRIIDLSYGAARVLRMVGVGTARVRIDVIKLGEEIEQ
jgi:rare lipoprotein A (peptidoglycan hydrolase)